MPANEWSEQYGPWALVTGASSGLGAEFARQLAAKGLNIIMTARRRDRMEALAEELRREHNVESRVISRDLTKSSACDEIAAAVEDLEIGLLINNAGFGLVDRFHNRRPGVRQRWPFSIASFPLSLRKSFCRPCWNEDEAGSSSWLQLPLTRQHRSLRFMALPSHSIS